ncbi:hypothetical protein [Campylobacter sputorum]|uniref:hypothetical protein n=1 Tax=Campylobacter sputorum TaxID=206 RepID=UPI00053BFAE1|nr:hypothetical protein [Campylobacter sputorum]
MEWTYKLYGILKSVFSYASDMGYIEYNIVASINLKNLAFKKEVKHKQAITTEPYFSQLVKAIYSNTNLASKNALKLVLHIPLRADRLINLKWEQKL